ncbi:DUF4198 domain-containing protein [Roseobacter denitrificans]|uniref:DUF4198 domain-containing protein n=1 Tax=Roseobacter denitrificans (strain ATCC 33942 / OCh 114) TaxID=375451 RepID=Q165S6_ROSDO|nr:DUF4198 domain-containing protein [Roseobacter denitrificans]ABG32267.1 conserved hypothetical protein [Roseobacter denitrificans OCh 114]AVL51755.1 DUF4198 domain-containing protein [Roseobacter denitrificans]SFF79575.1 protein of unknown function [Roseobacter denitrificans OCh 114]
MGFLRLSIFLTVLSVGPVFSHEFWIEPQQYQVESGAAVHADLKNGENFKGITLAWFENRFTRFETVSGDVVRPVTGRMGDTPALQMSDHPDGLLIVLHETSAATLTYRDWDRFLKFAAHKDFSAAARMHDDRGWPRAGFRESYTRHVKSLIAVGHGRGADRPFGLATEFTALTNPYDADFDGQMRVRLTYDGAPRPDAQVEVFERDAAGNVAVSLLRTDAQGLATVPVKPGHDYLFDAVVLRPSPLAGSTEQAPVWETLWAALTFSVPSR